MLRCNIFSDSSTVIVYFFSSSADQKTTGDPSFQDNNVLVLEGRDGEVSYKKTS
ncbi:hypothetical protein GW750_00830 [bacterium]|nr:hypothetical protein [bacterium]